MEVIKNNNATNRNIRNNRMNSSSAKPVFQAKTPMDHAKADIKRAVKKAAGRYVQFENGVKGLLVAAAMYDNWPHFVVVDRDRKVQYVPSSETFETLDFDINFSVLNYIRTHEPAIIEDLVKNDVNAICDRPGLLTMVTVQRTRPTAAPAAQDKKKPAFSGKKNTTK